MNADEHERSEKATRLRQREQSSVAATLGWQPIETAPKDHAIFVYAPSAHGLPSLMSVCQWHDDAGFCIDELREPTHWMPLPPPPKKEG